MDESDADVRLQARHEGDEYRRIEVIAGRRRRRNWTGSEKAQILAETAEPGASVSGVARRWGVSRGLVTVWRRQVGLVRRQRVARAVTGASFVPITITDGDGHELDRAGCIPAREPAVPPEGGRIEVETGGSRMVVTGRVDPSLAAAMVAALQRQR